jgi:hypothetical protein
VIVNFDCSKVVGWMEEEEKEAGQRLLVGGWWRKRLAGGGEGWQWRTQNFTKGYATFF